MRIEHVARVFVRKTNRNRCDLIDQARRQVDHLGPVGMAAKRGQTNARFLKAGYLRLAFPSAQMRQKYADRVEENCDSALEVRFFKHIIK